MASRGQRSSYRATMPAPTGGWNTRDDIGNMPAADAQVLDNWIPDVASVKPRQGFAQFASGVGSGSVDTLATFVTNLGANKFIAVGGGSIYDITSGTASSLASGLPQVPFDTVSFNNRLILVNGAAQKEYNGTTVTDAIFSDAISSRFFAAHVFKNRVYYAATDELAFWYTELFASTGIITKFPLAGIAEKGGSVVAINSWTTDGGSGPDDFLTIITSKGEVLVYQGTDPGLDFAIVGRFYVGPIVSNHAITQIYGKLFVVTERDYIYLPDQLIVKGGGKDTKLSGAAADAVKRFKNIVGWQAYYSANEGLLIVNVPVSNNESVQHVLNVKTGAATRFTGLNAKSWTEFGGSLYFGGVDGTVNKYTGANDGGSAIPCIARSAPSLLRSQSEKLIKAYQSRINSNGNLTLSTGLIFDFGRLETKQTQTISTETSTVLSVDWPWTWPDEIDPSRTEWFRGSGRGVYVQHYMETNIKNIEVAWFGNEFIVEPGGILL